MSRVVSGTAALSQAPKHGLSEHARYHGALRRRVLEAHPEAAALAGPDWRTAVATAFLLAIHWTAAWAVSRTSWWVVFLVALFFGQVVYHAASVLVHETTHRLVFRNHRPKLAYDLLLEAILTSFGIQLLYQYNHLTSHHPSLGDYEGDYEHEDLCRVAARRAYRARYPMRWRLIGIASLIVHLLPFGFLSDFLVLPRIIADGTGLPVSDVLRKTGAMKPPRGEMRLFMLFSLAVNIGLFVAFGFLGWLYQVWSMSLAASLWGFTLRGQILSEHPGDSEHPTCSTYWWGNRLFFNIGYHVEHHSLPNIPWTRLPKLKAMAPEIFNIENDLNYFGFWWKHLRSDFMHPKRCSAADPATTMRRRAANGEETPSTPLAA